MFRYMNNNMYRSIKMLFHQFVYSLNHIVDPRAIGQAQLDIDCVDFVRKYINLCFFQHYINFNRCHIEQLQSPPPPTKQLDSQEK